MELGWEARLAEARVAQAETAGEALLQARGAAREAPEYGMARQAALRQARAALAAARQAAHPAASARALLLVARLGGDLAALLDALAMFEGLQDAEGAARARLELAEQAVAARRPDAALAWLAPLPADPSAMPAGDGPGARAQVGLAAARVHHLHAAALRQAGRHEDALGRERRAWLALSLVPDTEQQGFRREVAQDLADALAHATEYQRALELHARAAVLAREEHDRPGELAAVAGLCGDLAGLGRFRDAAALCSRSLALAQELRDEARARELGRAGLALLGRLGESHRTARWQAFDAAAR